MTKRKPLVIVTRKLPDVVETRMRELFKTRLNIDDRPMTGDELAAAMREADVLVPTVTDKIDAGAIEKAGDALRLIAEWQNGLLSEADMQALSLAQIHAFRSLER